MRRLWCSRSFREGELGRLPGVQQVSDVLENEIIPLYYKIRSSDGLPGDWIAQMKDSIRTLAPQFSMRRMVNEYVERLYLPAMHEQKTPK